MSLENQKKFLVELLDKNLLYVNFSEIEDKNNQSTDEEKENKITIFITNKKWQQYHLYQILI